MPFGRKSCSACHGAEYRAPAPACGRCADLGAQVEDWLGEKCPPAVQGQGGQTQLLKTAAVLWGFFTDEGQVLARLTQYNLTCLPPAPESQVRRKVQQARQGLQKDPGFLIWTPWQRRDETGDLRPEGSHASGLRSQPSALPPIPEEVPPPWSRAALPFDVETLKEAAAAVGPVTREMLQARSVCRLDSVTPEFFLSSLYPAGSRVLVFTKFASQGQFLWEVPGGGGEKLKVESGKQKEGFGGAWKLAGEPGVPAVRAERLPREGNCGVWFLNQPVDGQWREVPGKKNRDGGPGFGRRHEACVQDWPFLVLESDIKGIEPLWLSFLAGLRLPIVAMYSSGGKSIHALVRWDAVSKFHWDVMRDQLRPFLTKCGTDPGVLTAVRLTRLPGCLRHGTEVKEKGEQMPDGRWKMEDGSVRTAPPGMRYVRFMGRDGKPEPRRQELLYFRPGAQVGRNIFEQK